MDAQENALDPWRGPAAPLPAIVRPARLVSWEWMQSRDSACLPPRGVQLACHIDAGSWPNGTAPCSWRICSARSERGRTLPEDEGAHGGHHITRVKARLSG